MNTMIRGLGLVVLLGMATGLSAADKEKQPKGETARPTAPGGLEMLKGLDLSPEQQAKVEQLRDELAPKLKEVWQKISDILTDEQKKARAEAFQAAQEAGKKGRELQKAVDAALKLSDEQKPQIAEIRKEADHLNREFREKVITLLNPAQKEKLEKRNAPRLWQFEVLKGLELTTDQKAKLEKLQKEFLPKIQQALRKMDSVLTDEQRKARAETIQAGQEAGKKWAEIEKNIHAAVKLADAQKAKMEEFRQELGELNKSLTEKIQGLLTPEQKEQLEKKLAEMRKKPPEKEGKHP
jgi:Spy/CpxP family protein refolding chaperone